MIACIFGRLVGICNIQNTFDKNIEIKLGLVSYADIIPIENSSIKLNNNKI
jgi:hypothetical protein